KTPCGASASALPAAGSSPTCTSSVALPWLRWPGSPVVVRTGLFALEGGAFARDVGGVDGVDDRLGIGFQQITLLLVNHGAQSMVSVYGQSS
ncbi:MAG: hypothetical protein JXA67_01480, partial [Micromonosporaceae bacterium]|nr:hypothetical protein [Micromonosporaceae bacterium]